MLRVLSMRLRLALVVAAVSGFVALSYEILWYRVLAVMTRGTAATFGLLLGAYLAGLAIGSCASARFCGGTGGDPRQLRMLAAFVAIANAVAALVVPAFAWSARFTDFRLGLAVVVIGAAFLGAVLPLVSHFGIEPDDRAGARLSYVYLANIIGSAAGSLVTGFVLMDRMTALGIGRLLVASGFVLAAALVATSRPSRAAAGGWYAAIVGAGVVAHATAPLLYDRVYERLVYKNEFDGTQRFAMTVETKSGVINVAADGTVYGGGAYDGVVNTRLDENERNGIVRAYLVGALHPAPRDVLMIGLSAGGWAEVVVHLPGVERMTAIEINPGYLDVIRAYPDVAGLLENPKLSIVVDDGRRWLHRHPDRRFDLVVMNTTMHWRAHATDLLSRDFMEIARRHLKPGGVLYFNTTNSLDVQLTAAKTFPHVLRIANFVAAADDPFTFDRERWKELLRTMRIEGKPVLDLARPEHRALYEELAGYNDIAPRQAILDFYSGRYGVVTDDNMLVEWQEPLRYPDLE